MAPEVALACPRELGEDYSNSSFSPSTLGLVAKQGKRSPGSVLTPPSTHPTDIYRCLKRRLGRTLRRLHSKRHLVKAKKSPSHKLFGVKGGAASP